MAEKGKSSYLKNIASLHGLVWDCALVFVVRIWRLSVSDLWEQHGVLIAFTLNFQTKPTVACIAIS